MSSNLDGVFGRLDWLLRSVSQTTVRDRLYMAFYGVWEHSSIRAAMDSLPGMKFVLYEAPCSTAAAGCSTYDVAAQLQLIRTTCC